MNGMKRTACIDSFYFVDYYCRLNVLIGWWPGLLCHLPIRTNTQTFTNCWHGLQEPFAVLFLAQGHVEMNKRSWGSNRNLMEGSPARSLRRGLKLICRCAMIRTQLDLVKKTEEWAVNKNHRIRFFKTFFCKISSEPTRDTHIRKHVTFP